MPKENLQSKTLNHSPPPVTHAKKSGRSKRGAAYVNLRCEHMTLPGEPPRMCRRITLRLALAVRTMAAPASSN